jgi:MFS family permease
LPPSTSSDHKPLYAEGATGPDAPARFGGGELRTVLRISTVSIARMFGLFMVLPVLAMWADGLAGATPLLVGIAVGGYGVTQALLQIPYGALSDRFGRAPVLCVGLLAFLAGSVIAARADTIGELITGRLLQGAGAISATLTAWLADNTREAVRTQAMAVFGASIGASFMLALILGPLLGAALGVPGLFWVSSGLAVLAILLVLPGLGTRPAAGGPPVQQAAEWRGLRRALAPELLELDIAVLTLHALLTAMFVLAPYVMLERFTLAADAHWRVYTLSLLAAVPVIVPLIMRDGREHVPRSLIPALLLMAGGFALMTLPAGSVILFGGGMAAFFAGFSYLEASLPAQLSKRADPASRGASMGVFSSSQFFGAFVGGGLAGWIAGAHGALSGMLLLAVAAAAWLALALLKKRRIAPV